MQQPTKDLLKDQLALAAEEIIRQRTMLLVYVRHPTHRGAPPIENPFEPARDRPWHRLWRRIVDCLRGRAL